MKKKLEPRTCIFCGERPVCNEHIWPQWCRELLPPAKTFSYRSFRSNFSQLSVEGGYDRQGAISSVKIKRVCRNCNSGWMSASENHLKPLLSKMMKGERCIISQQNRVMLAKYFTFKMIIIDWVEGHPTFPAYFAKEFFRNNKIPNNTHLNIANCFEGRWRAAHKSHSISLYKSGVEIVSGQYNTKCICLGFANLFVSGVFSSATDLEISIEKERTLQLWPLDDHEFSVWPPYFPITSDQAEQLTNIFFSLPRFGATMID